VHRQNVGEMNNRRVDKVTMDVLAKCRSVHAAEKRESSRMTDKAGLDDMARCSGMHAAGRQ
jgi:hypothetical protein